MPSPAQSIYLESFKEGGEMKRLKDIEGTWDDTKIALDTILQNMITANATRLEFDAVFDSRSTDYNILLKTKPVDFHIFQNNMIAKYYQSAAQPTPQQIREKEIGAKWEQMLSVIWSWEDSDFRHMRNNMINDDVLERDKVENIVCEMLRICSENGWENNEVAAARDLMSVTLSQIQRDFISNSLVGLNLPNEGHYYLPNDMKISLFSAEDQINYRSYRTALSNANGIDTPELQHSYPLYLKMLNKNGFFLNKYTMFFKKYLHCITDENVNEIEVAYGLNWRLLRGSGINARLVDTKYYERYWKLNKNCDEYIKQQNSHTNANCLAILNDPKIFDQTVIVRSPLTEELMLSYYDPITPSSDTVLVNKKLPAIGSILTPMPAVFEYPDVEIDLLYPEIKVEAEDDENDEE